MIKTIQSSTNKNNSITYRVSKNKIIYLHYVIINDKPNFNNNNKDTDIYLL